MTYTRRDFLIAAGATASSLIVPHVVNAFDLPKKRHIVTLSFDDGFRKSSIKTSEIYEKHKLSACINVVASASMKDFRAPDYPDVSRADFGLWNDLKARGHEIMPHGYRHANKQSLPFAESKDLILRCLDVFDKELKGFDRKQAVFNFPYNASTPELETVASHPGTCISNGWRSDQSAAAQGASEANLHELRARQLREGHRPRDREVAGEGVRLVDLQHTRFG